MKLFKSDNEYVWEDELDLVYEEKLQSYIEWEDLREYYMDDDDLPILYEEVKAQLPSVYKDYCKSRDLIWYDTNNFAQYETRRKS